MRKTQKSETTQNAIDGTTTKNMDLKCLMCKEMAGQSTVSKEKNLNTLLHVLIKE